MSTRQTPNTIYHNATVTRERRNQLNDHKSIVIWFTGLSGSGKSTLAHSVEEELHKLGCRTFVLDGDNVRHGLSSNLSFSDDDRKENIRRIGEAAKLIMEAGVIAITAFISPFKKDRNLVRQLLPQGDFIEIYCNASLEACESRDVKGLYKRARAGEIKNYTGIDSPYEKPDNPELIIDTESESLEDSVIKVIDFLKVRKIID
jgi:adenylylsulfate kinase